MRLTAEFLSTHRQVYKELSTIGRIVVKASDSTAAYIHYIKDGQLLEIRSTGSLSIDDLRSKYGSAKWYPVKSLPNKVFSEINDIQSLVMLNFCRKNRVLK